MGLAVMLLIPKPLPKVVTTFIALGGVAPLQLDAIATPLASVATIPTTSNP